MPAAKLPQNDLTRQIAERESELAQRRHQYYEARQALLADLNRRQQELQAQLQHVQSEISALSEGQSPSAAIPAAPTLAPRTTGAGRGRRGTLTDALVEAAREVNRPMTARELAQELVRRKYPTESRNLQGMVQNRLWQLVKRGIFRHAKGQRGFVLGTVAASTKAPPAPAAARKTVPSAKGAEPSKRGWRKGQPPLRQVLTELLEKSTRPMTARELAKLVLATGYKTKSKSFTDVVWTALGQLKTVENVRGEGWRLK